jgi:hypothetical protein
MNQPNWLSLIILMLGSVLTGVVGCSGPTPAGTVNGTVTLDGQPLKEGVVRFVPVDGKSPTASAIVTDGKFTASVPLGEMRVEFSAPRIIGRHVVYDTPDSPVVDEVAELIPSRFNTKSELKITVQKGDQGETFPLKSK